MMTKADMLEYIVRLEGAAKTHRLQLNAANARIAELEALIASAVGERRLHGRIVNNWVAMVRIYDKKYSPPEDKP